jgi:hypothetical protein
VLPQPAPERISHSSPSFATRRKLPSTLDSTCEAMQSVPSQVLCQKLSRGNFSDARLCWGLMRIARALMRGSDRLHPGGEKAHAASTPCHPLWKQPLARSLRVDISACTPKRRGSLSARILQLSRCSRGGSNIVDGPVRLRPRTVTPSSVRAATWSWSSAKKSCAHAAARADCRL